MVMYVVEKNNVNMRNMPANNKPTNIILDVMKTNNHRNKVWHNKYK